MDYPGYRVNARITGTSPLNDLVFYLDVDNDPTFNAGLKQAVKDYVNSLSTEYKSFKFYSITSTDF